MLVKDVSVVEDVDVDDNDGNGDDNEVDVEDWDEALANDKFEEGGNLVDERNDTRGNDGNGAVGDVDYEWYNSNYDNPANEKLYEIIMDEVDGNTFQLIITRNDQPSQKHTIAIDSLSRYCAELKRFNLGTTTRVIVVVPDHNFKRVYVYLATCKKGFVRYCRPLIILDACHLKGVVAGQLLVAVDIDGNDGMHPIAYAIAEAKDKETWTRFLENLVGDIRPMRDHGW